MPRQYNKTPKRKKAPKYRLKRKSYHVLNVENCADALRYYAGNQAAVAEAFGITRQAVCLFVQANPELIPIRDAAREVMVDEAENGIRNAVAREEGWACSLVVQTLGKHRGWVKGQVIGGGFDPETGNATPVVLMLPDDGRNPANSQPESLADLPVAEATTEEDGNADSHNQPAAMAHQSDGSMPVGSGPIGVQRPESTDSDPATDGD